MSRHFEDILWEAKLLNVVLDVLIPAPKVVVEAEAKFRVERSSATSRTSFGLVIPAPKVVVEAEAKCRVERSSKSPLPLRKEWPLKVALKGGAMESQNNSMPLREVREADVRKADMIAAELIREEEEQKKEKRDPKTKRPRKRKGKAYLCPERNYRPPAEKQDDAKDEDENSTSATSARGPGGRNNPSAALGGATSAYNVPEGAAREQAAFEADACAATASGPGAPRGATSVPAAKAKAGTATASGSEAELPAVSGPSYRAVVGAPAAVPAPAAPTAPRQSSPPRLYPAEAGISSSAAAPPDDTQAQSGPDPDSDEEEDLTVCAICWEVMRDPVLAADGFTYERSRFEAWLAFTGPVSPKTRAPLAHTHLTPNYSVRMLIQREHPQVQLTPFRL